MITVNLGTNTSRFPVMVSPDTTLKKVCEENNINYSSTSLHLDGAPLAPGDINKTFADLGITDKCFLVAVTKVDNAA